MKHSISSYIISILLIIIGLVAISSFVGGWIDGLESQPVGMLVAGFSLLAVGIITIPNVLDKLNDLGESKAFLYLGILGVLGLGYAVVNSVTTEIDFQNTKEMVEKQTIQRLKDIRDIQIAHRTLKGSYAYDFESLGLFIHEDVVPVTFNMGSFHDTLSEEKSNEQGYIIKRNDLDSLSNELEMTYDSLYSLIEDDNSPYKIRDTTLTSFYAENFTDEIRMKRKLPLFNIDSLSKNPLTSERFIMKISAVEVGRVWQPTILVQDPTPFGRDKVKKDTLRFGSLTEAHTDGNWRN